LQDLQAAAEVGANMAQVAQVAQVALVETGFIHRLGFLSDDRTGSLEMLVLRDEMASMANGFAGGIAVDDEALAFETVKRCAADNGFITDEHTIERYEAQNWLLGLFNRSDVGLWQEDGGRNMGEKIKDRLSDLLA
jgi:trimethylamine:corrinoid methyltransferase-like protein